MIKMGKYRKLLALLLSVMLLGSTVLLASCGEAETVVTLPEDVQVAPILPAEKTPEPSAEAEDPGAEQEPAGEDLSAEVGVLAVLESPEDVEIVAGETVVFTAKAQNYASCTWYFIFPDTEVGVSVETVREMVKDAVFTAEAKDGAEILTIEKTPLELDGCLVYAVFSDEADVTEPSCSALLTVTKNSTGNGNQGNPGTPNPPSGGSSTNLGHSHSWSPVYTVIHHDAEYETVHHDAVYYTGIYKVADEVPGWDETIHQTQCYCGQIFGSRAEWQAHAYSYLDTDEAFNHNGWTDASVIIYHPGTPAVYEERTVVVFEAYDEEVLIREAYDETVVDYYICSCGEKKLP